MDKEKIYTTDELEYIEGKEIPKSLQYVYIQNKRTINDELLIFAGKCIILTLAVIIFSMFSPQIFDFIETFQEALANNSNGVAH